MKKAVFLDRDGVINRLVESNGELISPRSMKDLRLYPGVKNFVSELEKMGFVVVVVSNKPDVAKGLLKMDVLEEMTEKIKVETGIKHFYHCLHHPNYSGPCNCRKPDTGLLEKSADDLDIDVGESYMVGDMPSDMEAGRMCKKRILIHNDGKEKTDADYVVKDFEEILEILKEVKQ